MSNVARFGKNVESSYFNLLDRYKLNILIGACRNQFINRLKTIKYKKKIC